MEGPQIVNFEPWSHLANKILDVLFIIGNCKTRAKSPVTIFHFPRILRSFNNTNLEDICCEVLLCWTVEVMDG